MNFYISDEFVPGQQNFYRTRNDTLVLIRGITQVLHTVSDSGKSHFAKRPILNPNYIWTGILAYPLHSQAHDEYAGADLPLTVNTLPFYHKTTVSYVDHGRFFHGRLSPWDVVRKERFPHRRYPLYQLLSLLYLLDPTNYHQLSNQYQQALFS